MIAVLTHLVLYSLRFISLISFKRAFEGVFAFTVVNMQLDASLALCIDQGG